MVSPGSPGIEPGVHHRGLAVLVAQQLSHACKVARICIEHDLCAEMTELMRGDCNSRAALGVFADQVGDSALRFRDSIKVHEQTLRAMTDMRRRDLVAVFHEHFGQMHGDIEPKWVFVFDLLGIEFER